VREGRRTVGAAVAEGYETELWRRKSGGGKKQKTKEQKENDHGKKRQNCALLAGRRAKMENRLPGGKEKNHKRTAKKAWQKGRRGKDIPGKTEKKRKGGEEQKLREREEGSAADKLPHGTQCQGLVTGIGGRVSSGPRRGRI